MQRGGSGGAVCAQVAARPCIPWHTSIPTTLTCMRVLISWNGVPIAAPTHPAPAPAAKLVQNSSIPCVSRCATSHFFSGMKVPV